VCSGLPRTGLALGPVQVGAEHRAVSHGNRDVAVDDQAVDGGSGVNGIGWHGAPFIANRRM
jgi:hypothetical protein